MSGCPICGDTGRIASDIPCTRGCSPTGERVVLPSPIYTTRLPYTRRPPTPAPLHLHAAARSFRAARTERRIVWTRLVAIAAGGAIAVAIAVGLVIGSGL